MFDLRRWGWLAIAAVALVGPASAQEPPTFAELMASLAQQGGLEARFREEKRIALLASPLVNEGTIHYAPPARLVRHTLEPEASSVLIGEDQLLVGTADSHRAIDVNESPVVRTFVDGFVGVVAGDREAIESSYEVSFQSSPIGWEIGLTPRDSRTRRLIQRVQVYGRAQSIERLVVSETNGDQSDTRFIEMRPRTYSAEELRRIFRLR